MQTLPAPWFYRISPKIHVDDSDNVGNKNLCGEEQNKFSKKATSSGDWTWDPRTLLVLIYLLITVFIYVCATQVRSFVPSQYKTKCKPVITDDVD